MMLDAVPDTDFSRLDNDGFRERVCEIEQARFGCFTVAAGYGAENTGMQLIDADKETFVALLIDQLVSALFGADDMIKDALGAMVGVEPDIKKSATVGGPDHAAGRVLNDVAEIFSRREIAHANLVELGTRIVHRPGEQPVIGRMIGAP